MPRAAPPATADDGSSTAAAPEPSMTSVSTTTVTDPSSVNTESAGVEDAESSQGGKPTQLESGHDLTAEEEALLAASGGRDATERHRWSSRPTAAATGALWPCSAPELRWSLSECGRFQVRRDPCLTPAQLPTRVQRAKLGLVERRRRWP